MYGNLAGLSEDVSNAYTFGTGIVVCSRTYSIVASSLSITCSLYVGDSNTNSCETACMGDADRIRAIQLTPSSKQISKTRLYAPHVYFSLTVQASPSRRPLAIDRNPSRSTSANIFSSPLAMGESLRINSDILLHFAETLPRIGTGEAIWTRLWLPLWRGLCICRRNGRRGFEWGSKLHEMMILVRNATLTKKLINLRRELVVVPNKKVEPQMRQGGWKRRGAVLEESMTVTGSDSMSFKLLVIFDHVSQFCRFRSVCW